MGFSYSKVQTFKDCPYKYRLRYIDKLEPLPDTSPDNALFAGTAVHEGIEKRSIEAALESYKSHYTDLSDAHEVEMLKIKTVLAKAIEQIPEGEYEHKLLADDGFIGFIDCLVKNEDGTYDILDFKYSNNVGGYLRSAQIHLYKYYFEKLTGNVVRDLYYVFIPKYKSKLTEDYAAIKEDIQANLPAQDINFQKVEYDKTKVGYFFGSKILMEKATVFDKKYSTTCNWCEYKSYCSSKGADTSELTEESKAKLAQLTQPKLKPVDLFGGAEC